MNSYSILINTCDSFEDCWSPFFKLFSIYWPDYNGKIYLNTEYKDFSYPGLDIISTKVCEVNNFPRNRRATWSQCLKWALEQIDTDTVLYMQEDYFLNDTVKNELVEKYVSLMSNQKSIDCIHLTDQGSPAGEPSEYEGLSIVPKHHRDRISCQAALWKTKTLVEYLRSYESGWSFEWWGSKRASIYNHNFYAVNREWIQLNQNEIIPYIFTGVIGGKWYKEVIPLFENHDILIDYNKRGFFVEKQKSLQNRINAKIKRIPVEIKSSWGLLILHINEKFKNK